MTLMQKFLGAAAALALCSGAAYAEPGLVIDLGGKFDKSFNEAAYNGAKRWADETGATYKEIELQTEAEREQFVRRLADTGVNPIVILGFQNEATLTAVAPDYPDTKFALIDAVVDLPNVKSIVFAEEQGSYLVGMMAAMASKTGTVGFVGGMQVPLISKFACGYAQGAKAANPDAKVLVIYNGTDPGAWSDKLGASEKAKAQISQGADVIFAAAGGAGMGVLEAAAEGNILSIGVDSNQNHLFPGKVLTSMMKRVDNAVYNVFKEGEAMTTGVNVLDLKAEGVGYALDDNNKALITPEMQAAVDAAAAKIASGELVVHNYMTDDSCPVN